MIFNLFSLGSNIFYESPCEFPVKWGGGGGRPCPRVVRILHKVPGYTVTQLHTATGVTKLPLENIQEIL